MQRANSTVGWGWAGLVLLLVSMSAPIRAETAGEAAQRQYEAMVEQAQQDYAAKVKTAREQLLTKLKSELVTLTKAGNLDDALVVRDRINELTAAPTPPATPVTAVPATDAAPRKPETVVEAAPKPAPAGQPSAFDVVQLKKSALQGFKIYGPDRTTFLINKDDEKGVPQIYLGRNGSAEIICLTNTQQPGGPKPERLKAQPAWHPSGKWIFMAVERDEYSPPPILGNDRKFVEGELQCGLWTNMWVVSIDGKQWHRLTDFKSNVAGVPDGYTGPALTPDGKRAVWSQIVSGNIFQYFPFGKWQMIQADLAERDGFPAFVNQKDITPEGINWNEPGNFSPDNATLVFTGSSEKDQEGMDQYLININTGKVTNLTNTPTVWDEHGLFSPDGERIVFMSACPYRSDPNTSKILTLKTEFMLMNKDGSGLTQLTHFREKGYPEYGEGIAAVAGWTLDGHSLLMSRLLFPKYEYWDLTFRGRGR